MNTSTVTKPHLSYLLLSMLFVSLISLSGCLPESDDDDDGNEDSSSYESADDFDSNSSGSSGGNKDFWRRVDNEVTMIYLNGDSSYMCSWSDCGGADVVCGVKVLGEYSGTEVVFDIPDNTGETNPITFGIDPLSNGDIELSMNGRGVGVYDEMPYEDAIEGSNGVCDHGESASEESTGQVVIWVRDEFPGDLNALDIYVERAYVGRITEPSPSSLFSRTWAPDFQFPGTVSLELEPGSYIGHAQAPGNPDIFSNNFFIEIEAGKKDSILLNGFYFYGLE
jgi:hypothetical protein